jgi:putative DNA primase/helicase
VSAGAGTIPHPSLLTAALEYAAKGWPIFPLKPRDKTPNTPNGFKDATTDAEQIRRWWKQSPAANIGLWCRDFVVLDVDPRNGGAVALEELLSTVADSYDFGTMEAATGGGGSHYIFKAPDFPVTIKEIAPGLDIKAAGGYIVAAPSIHPNGKPYQWVDDQEPAPLPAWLFSLLREKQGEKKGPVVVPPSISKGTQHDTLFKLAASLRAKGFDEEEIFGALVAASKRCEDIPPESHMRKLAASACRYPAGPSTAGPRADAGFNEEVERIGQWAEGDRREAYNAKRGLKASLGDAILGRHQFAKGRGGDLYIYMGGVYRRHSDDTIGEEVKEILEAWGKVKQWKGSLADEIEEYIRVSRIPKLDAKPPMYQLNVLNGILDLKNGQLHPHTPEYLSPVQIKIKYDPAAKCPAWEKFLESTFDRDLHPLIWQLIGWLLVPDTSPQKAVLLVGSGGNGKSVLLDALVAILGRENTSAKTLQQLDEDRFSCADLYGKLANICADIPTTEMKSSSMFKAIVSGDVIDAQHKHKDPFSFEPYARLVFSANAFPRSADATDGFFRRWVVIPFERSFDGTTERRNKLQLNQELQSPEELSGVLNMAIRALENFRMFGFHESKKVAEAGMSFRETTDPLAAWFEKRVKKVAESRINTKTLLYAFNDEVCRPNNQAFMTAHSMTKFLKAKGIEKRESDGYYYVGIELLPLPLPPN